MRLMLTLSMLFVLMVAPVFAQFEPATICEGAQEYYDSLKTSDEISTLVGDAVSGRVTARVAAIADISAYADELLTGDYPDCAARAMGLYSTGLTVLSLALEDGLNDDIINRQRQYTMAVQYIGEWRGYMRAIGVEVESMSNSAVFK
jgi:hypothetical protein